MTDARALIGTSTAGHSAGASSVRKGAILIVAAAVVFALIAAAVVVWVAGRSIPAAVPGASQALPFVVPVPNSSAKKVFAHYFPPYPISLDNVRASSDYYTRNYLSPNGEGGKFSALGGLLRDRPVGRPPRSGDWRTKDLTTEVRQAADSGIDGFTVDVLSLSGQNWDTTVRLMDAAERSGRDFRVVPNLDVTASAGSADPETVAAKLAELFTSPSAYRLADGRYVLSSFKAEGESVSWWSQIMSILERQYNDRVAFITVLLDASDANMRAFAPISYALSNWGSRTPEAVANDPNLASVAHSLGVKWMAPVAVQDVRPRSAVYAEAANTLTLRESWKRAIDDGADYVQLVTWNDYSEGTSFAPSVAHGRVFLDISAYYLAKFKTGRAPIITKDALYITNRIQFYSAIPRIGSDLMRPTLNCCMQPQDTVEALVMLTAPATVSVNIGGKSYKRAAPAGLSIMTFHLEIGSISATVSNGDDVLFGVASTHKVVARPTVQDLQYYAVGGTRS